MTREIVPLALVACLACLWFSQPAQAMNAAERAEAFRQKVEQLGVGAEVRVTHKDRQQALQGTIESFDDSFFSLRPGGPV